MGTGNNGDGVIGPIICEEVVINYTLNIIYISLNVDGLMYEPRKFIG